MKASEKQINFYRKWTLKRTHKVRYVLVEGMLYWALPFSIFMILFELIDGQFIFSIKILVDFFILYILSSVLGIITALFSFKEIDKNYLKFKDKLKS